MIEAILVAASTFSLSFIGLMLVEKLIHHLTKNPDRSYRWGVWLFSILFGAYMFINYLGR